MSGKLHIVPALINDDYVIRFAICAQHAVDDDVIFAWNVISEMATQVLAMFDTEIESAIVREHQQIEALEKVTYCFTVMNSSRFHLLLTVRCMTQIRQYKNCMYSTRQ